MTEQPADSIVTPNVENSVYENGSRPGEDFGLVYQVYESQDGSVLPPPPSYEESQRYAKFTGSASKE